MPLTRGIDIGTEARILSKTYSDLDNFRRFYGMVETGAITNANGSTSDVNIKFVAPKLFLFEEFRFTLLKNSVTKPLTPLRYYRPDYVSYEEYGTINLWAMLLFINDIPTIEDFDVEHIKIPSKSSIMKLTNAATSRKTLEIIVPMHERQLKPTPQLYSKKKTIPNEITKPTVVSQVASNVYFNKDTFTLNLIDIRNRYVDLEFQPIPNSVTFNIENAPNYMQGKHYDIIRGSNGYNRLTWDPRKIPNGVGMLSIMRESMYVEISYAKKSVQ